MAKEKEKGKEATVEADSDTSSSATQSTTRPPVNRHDSDSQASDNPPHHAQRPPKHPKHVKGGAGVGRLHARVNSSKALHKHHGSSSTKLNRRLPSPEPENPPQRRTTSDLKTPAEPSSSTLNLNLANKNSSHSNLAGKRNRSHADFVKRPKSSSSIKRSSSHKEVNKLKGAKTQVHFDLGEDGQDDEWVDASGSASPFMSRRGSVMSSGHSPKVDPDESDARPHTPVADTTQAEERASPSNTQTTQHNNYITSRLLQRTPSHSVPPKMSTENVSVPPRSASPESQSSRGPPSLYGTPKANTLEGGSQGELTSRFVTGSGSGPTTEAGLYFPNPRAVPRRPQSLGNLNKEHRISASDDENDSALAPRTRRPIYRALPAEKSRTQQKLNLQRASSSMEPAQSRSGAGGAEASPLVGGSSYDNRDPRIGKLLERTGMEYLVVRRYQNPIARSIARLSHVPSANKNQRIVPRQNGVNGAAHAKKTSDLGGARRSGLSQSLGADDERSDRPTTPRRSVSIRTTGASSSFDGDDRRLHDRISGSIYVNGADDDGGVAALLRNLWDKNMDLSASQD